MPDHLQTMFQRANQWKVTFNFDFSEQVQEVIFSRKIKDFSHLTLNFHNSSNKEVLFQNR